MPNNTPMLVTVEHSINSLPRHFRTLRLHKNFVGNLSLC